VFFTAYICKYIHNIIYIAFLKNTSFEAGNRVLKNIPINRPLMLHDGLKTEELLLRYE